MPALQLKKPLLTVFSICVLLFSVGVGVVTWRLYENGKQIHTLRTAQVRELMDEDTTFFEEVFTKILPDAVRCETNTDCTAHIRTRLDELTHSATRSTAPISAPAYFSKVYIANDQPFYFIALDQGHIIKLFFSGETVTTPITTHKESLVKEVLLGKREHLYGIQANQDGLRMTYLNDLYSEAEVIVPYRKDGKILGAVVYLHGD